MAKWSNDNGPITGTIEIDGYSFGDVLLEGVMFRADVKDGKVKKVYVRPEDESYFSGLNKKHWLKEAKEEFEKTDIANIVGTEEEVFNTDTAISSNPIEIIVTETPDDIIENIIKKAKKQKDC